MKGEKTGEKTWIFLFAVHSLLVFIGEMTMPTGIIIVDKPSGWTSQDVVAKLKGVFHVKRIGHGGTLDPMATGVLPVFMGRSTRAVEFFESAQKEYVAGLRLGLRTNTQDTTGETLETADVCVTREDVEQACRQFLGDIAQLPPMFSAIKIGGKKLYQLARAGKEVERKKRNIHIFALEVLDGDGADWQIRIHCSKGTYIRTLCNDIGEVLGCGGCMSSLRRTMAGRYTLQEAIPLLDIIDHPNVEELLLPTDSLFDHLPTYTITAEELPICKNGGELSGGDLLDGDYRVYAPDGSFLMVGNVTDKVLKTVKSYFEV